jgi:hypothetical protein
MVYRDIMSRLPGVGCSTSRGHMHTAMLADPHGRGNGAWAWISYFCGFEAG